MQVVDELWPWLAVISKCWGAHGAFFPAPKRGKMSLQAPFCSLMLIITAPAHRRNIFPRINALKVQLLYILAKIIFYIQLIFLYFNTNITSPG